MPEPFAPERVEALLAELEWAIDAAAPRSGKG
jgi:hypothetical protein